MKNATRTFTKEGGNALLIEDKIKPNENTKYVTWQLVTQADVEIVDDGALLKQDGNGGAMKISVWLESKKDQKETANL